MKSSRTTRRLDLAAWLRRCVRGPKRRGALQSSPSAQPLEVRVLPAGNVNVRMTDNVLVINGDTDDNSVSIIVDDGSLVVRGLEDTTINGSEDDFIIAEDSDTFSGRVSVKLGTGDDTFAIGGGVVINGRLMLEDYFGDDLVSIDDAEINGGILIRTHFGNDSIRFNGTSIHGATYLFTGFGDDLVVLDQVTTAAYFRISSGPGDDGVDTDSNTFQGRFVTRLGFGEDDANFDGDNVDDAWIVRGRSGDDAVRATNMLIEGFTWFRSTKGDDNFLLTGDNVLHGRLIAMAGRGDDHLELSAGTEALGGVTTINVEDGPTDATVFTSRFDAATVGLIARADALRASIDGALELTLDTPANTTQSNGVLLTSQQQLTVTGTTHADATITVDADNDGQFDDGTVIANNDGTFSLNVTLVSNLVSPGTQTLKFRSTFGGTTVNQTLAVDVVVGTVVRFSTALGNFDVELFNADAPITVTNFLNYLDRYADSIIHRSERNLNGTPFVIQGGGFSDPPDVMPIPTDAPITNEFKAANSNDRGTLSMALPSGMPNGGTSQWFINTGDNSSLDAALHTVFGKVLGSGMDVVDDIHDLTSFNLIGPTGLSALANVPLRNYTPFTESLTGTASVTSGTKTVTGVGTSFLTDLVAGEAVKIGDVVGVVASIQSDTSFTLAVAAESTVNAVAVRKNALPDEASYVTFSSVATLTV